MSKNQQSASKGGDNNDTYYVVCRDKDPGVGFVMDKQDANHFAYGRMGGEATGTYVEKRSYSEDFANMTGGGGGSSGNAKGANSGAKK
jgi:hypothetical protein